VLKLDLESLPELENPGGAVRIEGDVLPNPILVFHGRDGQFYALKNACTHAGRMIDTAADGLKLEYCSLGSSTFDYQGNVLSGPATAPLRIYSIEDAGGILTITIA
jgi:nitrite reductase/ring-hydroxylating ferredoxin subunit